MKLVSLNTVLVFIVYSLNFLMLVGAISTIVVFLFEESQRQVIENLNINFEFLILFKTALIIVAIVVALVSFMGCFGIAIDNDYLLVAYIVSLGILMAAQLLLSIFLRNKLASSEASVGNTILSFIRNSTQTSPANFYRFQDKFKCCGFDGYQDWTQRGALGRVPGSCCEKPDTQSCQVATVSTRPGCKKAVSDEISSMLKSSIYIVFVIFGLEVILAVCTILVIMDIGQPDEDNTSDEIVVVAALKKPHSSPKDYVKYEESIDTHDTAHKPDANQSPIIKEEAVGGLYDEENVAKRAAEDEEQEHDEDDGDDDDDNYEEESPKTNKSRDEKKSKQIRKMHDEESYLEGNLDQQKHEEHYVETGVVGKEEQGENDEEEEVEEEEGKSIITNQSRIEENIHVSKSKFSNEICGGKIQKERNRDRKRFK